MLTLEEFHSNIIVPSVIDGVKSGRFDAVLSDPEVIYSFSNNVDILNAAIERIRKILNDNPKS